MLGRCRRGPAAGAARSASAIPTPPHADPTPPFSPASGEGGEEGGGGGPRAAPPGSSSPQPRSATLATRRRWTSRCYCRRRSRFPGQVISRSVLTSPGTAQHIRLSSSARPDSSGVRLGRGKGLRRGMQPACPGRDDDRDAEMHLRRKPSAEVLIADCLSFS